MWCCGGDVANNVVNDKEVPPSSSKPMKFIISGAPASGKGTQCENIVKRYGVVHLSTGDMLRAAVKEGTEIGLKAKEYMDEGKLVPDDVIVGVITDRLKQNDCIEKGWLLDGFPRTSKQAIALAESDIDQPDCFILLNVPDELLIERVVGRRNDPVTNKIYHLTYNPPPSDDEELLKRLVHRSDDTEEKVKVRLEQYHSNVGDVKGHYVDIMLEVDGTGKPDEVSDLISKGLKEKIEG